MDMTEDEILQILKIADESNFDELCLETNGLKLVLGKKGAVNLAQGLGITKPQSIPDKPFEVGTSERKASLGTQEETTAVEPSITPEAEGLLSVTAPILGIFYRTSRPGAAPFVEEGKSVTENDTVGLIEVMKVFTNISAGVRGSIVKVCAETGQMVEFGQTLFLIRPEEEK
ncbi:acetyl-CoA carboxylase biotin carboxyl carrier protein [Chloroflexota bacterium]